MNKIISTGLLSLALFSSQISPVYAMKVQEEKAETKSELTDQKETKKVKPSRSKRLTCCQKFTLLLAACIPFLGGAKADMVCEEFDTTHNAALSPIAYKESCCYRLNPELAQDNVCNLLKIASAYNIEPKITRSKMEQLEEKCCDVLEGFPNQASRSKYKAENYVVFSSPLNDPKHYYWIECPIAISLFEGKGRFVEMVIDFIKINKLSDEEIQRFLRKLSKTKAEDMPNTLILSSMSLDQEDIEMSRDWFKGVLDQGHELILKP